MGRPKALLPWQGRTLVEHLVEVLREACGDVVVVASEELELPSLPAQVIRDRTPDLGPLGGIRESLHAVQAELVLVSGIDAPFLDAGFARWLLSRGRTTACRVGGRVQPFPGVYERRLAPIADALIEQGRMRPPFLLEAADFECVEEAELDSTDVVRSFNTPREYLEAIELSEWRGSVEVVFEGRCRRIAGVDRLIESPGTLSGILEIVDGDGEFSVSGHVAPGYEAWLNGTEPVRRLDVPLAPGERVLLRVAGDDSRPI